MSTLKTPAAENSSVVDLTQSDEEKTTSPCERSHKKLKHRIDSREDDVVEVVKVAKAPPPLDAATAVSTARVAKMPSSTSKHYSTSSTSSDHALAVALASGVTQSYSSSFRPVAKKKKKSHFSCGICLEDQVPSCHGYNLETCNHRFCVACIIDLIKASMNAKSTDIRCPEDKCNSTLSMMDIRFVLRGCPLEFQQFADLAAMQLLESEAGNDNSDTRRCPAERCNYIFAFTPGRGVEGRHFSCPQCKASYCLHCGANGGKVGPAHPNMTCVERLEQLQKEARERHKFEQWQKENSQADEKFNELMEREGKAGRTLPCPNCKAPITKNGGCAHMHCIKCHANFNWRGHR